MFVFSSLHSGLWGLPWPLCPSAPALERRDRLLHGVCASWTLRSLGVRRQRWVWEVKFHSPSSATFARPALRPAGNPTFLTRTILWHSFKASLLEFQTPWETVLSPIFYFQNDPMMLVLSSSFYKWGSEIVLPKVTWPWTWIWCCTSLAVIAVVLTAVYRIEHLNSPRRGTGGREGNL